MKLTEKMMRPFPGTVATASTGVAACLIGMQHNTQIQN